MFEDGICEVEKGLYSKSIKFDDINYQIARREEQVEIFSCYCEFLNYFDPSINLQLTIHNKHINKDDFKARMLYPIGRGVDELDKYRKENNAMLSEKALQGQNSIIREKYLTFAVKANDYEASIPSLARLETDIMTNFKSLGCEIQLLSGAERLSFIHKMFNPQDKFLFNYDYLLDSSLTTKDYIAPDSFNFAEKRYFEFGDNYGQTLFLKDLPPDLSDKLITELSDIPCNMTITLHINSVEQDKAFALVKQKISFMEQQKIDEQKKALKSGYDVDMIPYELKYSLNEAEELLDDMQNKNQRMFKVTLLIYTSADNIDTLNDNVYQIMAAARKNNCKIGYLDYLQKEGMNSTMPVGKNHIEIQRTLTTASTGIFIPFTTQELFQEHGMYYGLNALSRNLIFFNRKTLKNPNGFILGTPGSGKSFSAKREITNVLLNTDDEVLVIDPEREYTALAKGFDGEIIHISAGSKAHINPLDITMDYADDDNPLLLKSEFVLSLCELLVGGKAGLTAAQRTVIDRACLMTYEAYFANPAKNPVPTLKDFYKMLKEQPEPEAISIALSLELYIEGSLSVFAHPTNIDTNNRFIVFDIRDLGKQLKTMGMLIVLDQIWNRITQNRALGKRTWIYIDEIYLLFQNEYSANYLFELYKRARKWGAIPTGITQNVEDLLVSDMARRMLSNTDFVMMLNQSASDRVELAALLNISNQQLSYVTNSQAGQGLLFAGNSIIPFIDKFPQDTELYSMMTTKIEEITALAQEETELAKEYAQ
ncbi:MAG: ATP-binding protein [Oscillospiraceae bacterium]